MPIETFCGIQLALYAAGWALAAWLVVEERPAMLHWMTYAALQAGSVVLALPALSAGTAPPVAALLASVLGFAAAVRGLEDRKSTRLNSSHTDISRMPSSA